MNQSINPSTPRPVLSVDRLHVLCGVPAASCAVLWASTRHWVPNDIIGVSICIEGITELKLPSYFAGLIAFVCT